MPRDRSWHVPTVYSYRIDDPLAIINVVFLQRMSESDLQEAKTALETVDQDATKSLNIEQSTRTRPLHIKKWIRDYAPSSATTLEIARAAYYQQYHSDHSFTTLVFVDSGWDLGNVIAAHWEKQDGDGEAKLSAARVPTGIANVLLAACDQTEGLTLSQALGPERFELSQVDLYKDLPVTEAAPDSRYDWPAHLPEYLDLNDERPIAIALRRLDDTTMQKLRDEIKAGSHDDGAEVQIYNWEGDPVTDRLLIRDLYDHMHRRTKEKNKNLYAWFIDYLGKDVGYEPQLLAVCKPARSTGYGAEVLPIFTSKYSQAREITATGRSLDEEGEIVDIWAKERVNNLSATDSDAVSGACPIFFLRPFTQEQEQRARKAVCALGDVEEGEDWGHTFVWYGYIFEDGQEHTLEDLRNLFERSDPFSPFFDKSKSGSHRLSSYPSNFVALDERVLNPENPKVWMASSLDFHGEDVSDQLGWTTGRLDAAQTYIIFTNLDIANMGPDECFDEDTVDNLWLSDLSAYREEDWEDEQDA